MYNGLGDLSVKFKGKIMFKSDFKKSNHKVPRNNKIETYKSPVFHLITYRQTKCILCTLDFCWAYNYTHNKSNLT